MLGNFSSFFCPLQRFFFKFTFSKNYFRNTIRVSNGLEPDQASCSMSVRPDLGPKYWQRLSADNSRFLLSFKVASRYCQGPISLLYSITYGPNCQSSRHRKQSWWLFFAGYCLLTVTYIRVTGHFIFQPYRYVAACVT